MADIIDPKKKLNLKWKNDPVFMEGFDYEKPEYADVPDGLKWALPIHECLGKPEVKERGKRLQEESKKRVEKEMREERKQKALSSRKLSIVG